MKQLSAKVGEYQNQQGEQKGEYVKIGVLMENSNGQYILLNPEVCLAGVALKQMMLSKKQGKDVKDSVMVSVFDNTDGQTQVAPPTQVMQPPIVENDIPY